MNKTGIVRRIDDLGRVVIPKEIRRNFRIREGDPLEIITAKECIVLRKYEAFCKEDFIKARELVRTIIPNTAFAVLDNYGTVQSSSNSRLGNLDLDKIKQDGSFTVYEICDFNNIVAYLAVVGVGNVIPEKLQTTRDILKVFFTDCSYMVSE